ncbi:14448_t:CDS:2 [Entrophospora sp. SA101]|nr:13578_t:CDS:2 [Entrophospora sp. SA101]CAJ0632695.1 15110_t:CDS:2 [Entrophospora sp. SA101]CAJ0641099.1 14448_t:CDS:2 [Entrophospora sp. SA101]CAJ0837388.1 13742_t:CDS:2 [Entrophospora sp. SA101]
MSSTNTPVVARNHTASYVRSVLNTRLNSRSIIIPTSPNLPRHTLRQLNQRTIVQQPQQQSTNNNNINNGSIPQQTRPSTISQPSIKQLRRLDNNSIDLEYDNPPKDYDKEPSFDEIFKSIRDLNNTMKDNMDTGEVAKRTEESHTPCRTYVENSSDLDCISSALSKSA